ncbi:MAG: glycosyltransferase family 39 protein [Candidatus Wallbacteria bacterium]|nr:glycosyltransferase family 39 protein [Candidatus Wallbacteria bacterium]
MDENSCETALRRPWLLLLFAVALLYFARLGAHDLWEPDEPNFALTSREMIEKGQYVLPTLNGSPEGEKPPMFYWCVVAASKLAGCEVSELTTRIPSAVGMFLTVLAVGLAGTQAFGRRAGLLAAMVMATCHLAVWEARTGQVDALNCGLITLAFVWFYRASRQEPPSLLTLVPAYGFASLAVLTKGQPGLLLTVPVFFLHGLLLGRFRPIRRMRLEVGVPIGLVFGLIWLVPLLHVASFDFLRTILYRQTVVRYFNPWHHQQPLWYYLTTLPLDFLPWTIFLPGVVALAWRDTVSKRDPGTLYALLWFALVFLYFSLTPGKRSIYVLPAFPALALLTGRFLDAAIEAGSEWRQWVRGPAWAWAAVLALVGLAAPVLISRRYPPMMMPAAGLTPLLLVGVIVLVDRLRQASLAAALGALATVTVAFNLYLHAVMLPAFNPYNSSRSFCAHLLQVLPPGEQPISYRFFRGTYGFYSHKRFVVPESTDELAKHLLAHPSTALIAQKDQLPELLGDGRFRLEILEDTTIGARPMILAKIRRVAGPKREPGP